MKTWFTKTGIELKVIQGGGETTPRIDFRTQTPVDTHLDTHMNEYDLALLGMFKRASIYITSQTRYGAADQLQLHVQLTMDADLFPKSKKMQHSFKGNLALDTSNYLSRFHRLNTYLVPSIDATSRSSKGRKVISLVYDITRDIAVTLGMPETKAKSYNPYHSIKKAE